MSLTKRNLWFPLMAGILLTLFFYFLGALLSGGGHTLTAMLISFPYGVVVGQWLKDSSWEFVEMLLLLIQFPLYSLLLAWVKGRGKAILLIILLIVHSLVVIFGWRMI